MSNPILCYDRLNNKNYFKVYHRKLSYDVTTLHQVRIMILNWPRLYDPYLHDICHFLL